MQPLDFRESLSVAKTKVRKSLFIKIVAIFARQKKSQKRPVWKNGAIFGDNVVKEIIKKKRFK